MRKTLVWSIIGALAAIITMVILNSAIFFIACGLVILGCGWYITDAAMIASGHDKKWPKIVKIATLWAGILLLGLGIGLIAIKAVSWTQWIIIPSIVIVTLGILAKIANLIWSKNWMKTTHKAVFFPGISIFMIGIVLAIIFNPASFNTIYKQSILNHSSYTETVVSPKPSVTPSTSSVVSTDIGYINYSVDGTTWQKANELTGDYGHRVAMTCAQALFPNAAWDYKYSGDDWKKIENTWINVQVSVPNGAIARVWCYSWKQGTQVKDGGYLMELGQGSYEFSIKNGEIQNWNPDDSYFSIDLNRIFTQKREGNVNVEHELAFTGITANLKDKVPSDLKYNEVTVGPTSSK